MYISVDAWMSVSCKKEEFDRGFNRLDCPVEESRPDRPVDPTSFHLWLAYRVPLFLLHRF